MYSNVVRQQQTQNPFKMIWKSFFKYIFIFSLINLLNTIYVKVYSSVFFVLNWEQEQFDCSWVWILELNVNTCNISKKGFVFRLKKNNRTDSGAAFNIGVYQASSFIFHAISSHHFQDNSFCLWCKIPIPCKYFGHIERYRLPIW